MKYEREVWNFEEAFGWLGGLTGIIMIVVTIALSPFIKDEMVIELAKSTDLGKFVGLSSKRFRCNKII